MTLLKWLGIGVAVLLVIFAALSAYGRWRWAELTAQLVGRLETARATLQPARFDPRELEALPAPVQRFFRAAVQDAQPMIVAVDIEHSGTFNLAAEGPDQWKPFKSKQRTRLRRPGFVWDGRVNMLPGVAAYVHDAYVAGEGILHPAVMGLISLTHLRGNSPEAGGVAHGEFMRWFAEAAWYPTALLPSQGVQWNAVDEHSAQATASDGIVSVTLLFRFGTNGLIESVRAEARGRTVNATTIMTPWEGRWSNYQVRDGMHVPMTGEVAWLTPQGRKSYWRGNVTRLRYEFAVR